eukprot:CAMPEP_0176138432 /NCGR_PEP_ID=MMETSP0120_2-20121206/70312_1 /TAXON_ID=160619 /ORGANISM="Kryptoperidinium foliaceum, Strain CCMP 1326" /LENGTH=44 /DNA_ID= /DNA_START= /DNA_END= /DNA_ORIENTATION=
MTRHVRALIMVDILALFTSRFVVEEDGQRRCRSTLSFDDHADLG